MGKVVKFCGACEEGFAERFGFCPNCGGSLAAYEMNPIAQNSEPVIPAAVSAPGKTEPNESAWLINEVPTAPPSSFAEVKNESAAPVSFSSTPDDTDDEILEITDEPKIIAAAPPVAATEPVKSAAAAPEAVSNVSSFTPNYRQSEKTNGTPASSPTRQRAAVATAAAQNGSVKHDDGLYHISFVDDKNASWRNMLMLGAFLFVTTITLGGVGYSLFAKNAYIGSLSDPNSLLAFVEDVEPAAEIEEEAPKKNPDKGGGGGGGGREEETPTSKGRLAPQMRATPMLTPTKTIEQKDFELKYQATTVGDKQVKATNEKYGDPASKFDISSDGMGSGGGQGSGQGTGQGSGRGRGQGSGIGDGSGSGIGTGNGPGTGSGDNAGGDPPPPVKKSPPEPIKIISKPRPSYTDAARQNQVTGVVRLKVTFLASGQVGSVAPISGLPYGLTEQAIAAAKQIRFEPAKVNGQAQTVSRTIEYSFSIY